jgi:putative phage-type endonuclease
MSSTENLNRLRRSKTSKITQISHKKSIKNKHHIYIDDMLNCIDNLTKLDLFIYKHKKANIKDLYKSYLISNTYMKEYDIDFVENRYNELFKYKKILKDLKKLKLIKQRTEEWFNIRKQRLTASDLGEAISNNNTRLAKKKAGVLKDNTNYTTIAPLKWGTMFENMAMRCYSQDRDNIVIHEFGLIEDKTNIHFGASPDGITDMGIMIEIKCPYSRKIKEDEIPRKYQLQIQGQLAVCDLNECDYIECEFKTYLTDEEYINDIINNFGNSNKHHGVIAEFINSSKEYEYIYSDKYLTVDMVFDNIANKMSNSSISSISSISSNKFIKFTKWRLVNINVQRVKFDKNKWDEIVPKINSFWDKVEEFKKSGVGAETGAVEDCEEEAKSESNSQNKDTKFNFIEDSD